MSDEQAVATTAERGPRAEPHCLRGRLDAERTTAPLRAGNTDDNRNAVRSEQRPADALENPEPDKHRQVVRQAAE